jgi:hypothetical protein
MNSKQLRLFGSIMPVMYGVIMLTYGTLWFAAMGSAQMNDDAILTAVRAPWWIPLSVLGYAGVLAGIPAFASFYLSYRDRAGKTGFLGALFMVWALVIQGSSVSWEIAIYPLLAKLNPEIISSGAIYQNPVSGSIYLALLVFMISGSIMTGISLFRSGNVSKISALGIAVFGTLYSVVVMVPPAIGAPVMVLYTLSVISAGISMLKHHAKD